MSAGWPEPGGGESGQSAPEQGRGGRGPRLVRPLLLHRHGRPLLPVRLHPGPGLPGRAALAGHTLARRVNEISRNFTIFGGGAYGLLLLSRKLHSHFRIYKKLQ